MPLGVAISSWGLCNCPGAALAGTFSWVAHQVCCTWAQPRCLWELSLPSLLPSNPGVRLRGSCPPCTGKNRLRDLLANPAAPSTLGKGSSSGRWKGLASPWVLPIPSISLQFCSYPSHNHQVTHLSFKWPCFFSPKTVYSFYSWNIPFKNTFLLFLQHSLCVAAAVSRLSPLPCWTCPRGMEPKHRSLLGFLALISLRSRSGYEAEPKLSFSTISRNSLWQLVIFWSWRWNLLETAY